MQSAKKAMVVRARLMQAEAWVHLRVIYYIPGRTQVYWFMSQPSLGICGSQTSGVAEFRGSHDPTTSPKPYLTNLSSASFTALLPR